APPADRGSLPVAPGCWSRGFPVLVGRVRGLSFPSDLSLEQRVSTSHCPEPGTPVERIVREGVSADRIGASALAPPNPFGGVPRSSGVVSAANPLAGAATPKTPNSLHRHHLSRSLGYHSAGRDDRNRGPRRNRQVLIMQSGAARATEQAFRSCLVGKVYLVATPQRHGLHLTAVRPMA